MLIAVETTTPSEAKIALPPSFFTNTPIETADGNAAIKTNTFFTIGVNVVKYIIKNIIIGKTIHFIKQTKISL